MLSKADSKRGYITFSLTPNPYSPLLIIFYLLRESRQSTPRNRIRIRIKRQNHAWRHTPRLSILITLAHTIRIRRARLHTHTGEIAVVDSIAHRVVRGDKDAGRGVIVVDAPVEDVRGRRAGEIPFGREGG